MSDILSLRNITKSFGALRIATALDFDVPQGQAVGIIGPNGAGKTTLLGMVGGAIRPDAGTITFDGEDITRLPPEMRCRRGIARAFQVPQPFGDMTVYENLLVAAGFGAGKSLRQSTHDCLEILDRCGLADRANEPAGSLRLLDRKRLELARSLATNPRLLLLDEVAGGLTEHECQSLIALINSLKEQGLTIVWIEHVIHALVAVVSRVVVLYGGELIADGEPNAVIKSPKVAEIYMGVDADV